MCVTYAKYDCRHILDHKRDCKEIKQRKEALLLKKKQQKGFWKSILSSCDPKIEVLACRLPPGQAIYMAKKCPDCTEQNKAKEEARWRRKMVKENELENSKRAFGNAKADIHRQIKWNWLCQSCKQEGRLVDNEHREVNGGACCARGVDEFEEYERGRRAHTSSSREPSRKSRTNSTRVSAPISKKTKQSTHDDAGLARAKLAASEAARGYGHEPNEDSLHPGVVGSFVGMSGTDFRVLAITPTPPEPQPYCEDLHLDLGRWDGASRAGHGSYPAPTPAPDAPLPILPLRARSKHGGRELPRLAEPHRNCSISKPDRPMGREIPKRASSQQPLPASHSTRSHAPASGSSRSPATPTQPQDELWFSTLGAPKKPQDTFNPRTHTDPARKRAPPPSSHRSTALETPSRKPVGSGSHGQEHPLSRSATTPDLQRQVQAPRKPTTVSHPSRSSTTNGPPTSRYRPQDGRRISICQSRGQLVPMSARPWANPDPHGISPPSSPTEGEGESPISPQSATFPSPMNGSRFAPPNTLRTMKSTIMSELNHEIHDTQDSYRTNTYEYDEEYRTLLQAGKDLR